MTLYDLVAGYRDYMNHFSRAEYQKYFETYLEACRPVFDGISDPETAVAELFQALSADWSASRSRRKNTLCRQNDKMLICCYLNPAAGELGDSALNVVREIQRIWKEKYPDEAYELGRYDLIMKGFEPRIFGFLLRQN